LSSLKRIFSIILLVILAGVFAAFAIDNRQPVTFSLFPLPYTAEMPVFALVLLSFMLGALVAGLIATLSFLRSKVELSMAKRHVAALENEVGGLRAERNVLPMRADDRL
jgi:putative membrane protein